MTAKALLIHTSAEFISRSRQEQLELLDREVAENMLGGRILTKPACLSPLPLAGVPGWWPKEEQEDNGFYTDLQVFRTPPADLTPIEVLELQL